MMGYRRANDICQMDTFHGFLFVHPGNHKSRLIFDFNDGLAGIQTAIPGNLYGFNTYNQSIHMPTKKIIPPILLSKEQYAPGLKMYTITAYFKHPSLICSPMTHLSHPGKGLFIQMGYKVERSYERIPLDADKLSSDWQTGTCLPGMGRHYFRRLSPSMPCEQLYPVFLMYNREGQLGGFGWLFQGTPPPESNNSPFKWFKYSPQFYPAIFDQAMLPSCMFNPDFNVFGVRIYLRNENTMTCPRPDATSNSEGGEGHEGETAEGDGGQDGAEKRPSKPNNTKVTLKPHHHNNNNNNNKHNHRNHHNRNRPSPFDGAPEYINSFDTDQNMNSISSNKHRGSSGSAGDSSNNNNNVIVDDVMRNQGNGASESALHTGRRLTANMTALLVSFLLASFLSGLLTWPWGLLLSRCTISTGIHR